MHLRRDSFFIFAIGPHAIAILHRMTARTAFPFAGRSRPNPSGELESQQALFYLANSNDSSKKGASACG